VYVPTWEAEHHVLAAKPDRQPAYWISPKEFTHWNGIIMDVLKVNILSVRVAAMKTKPAATFCIRNQAPAYLIEGHVLSQTLLT
jgi:hypothetical protein